MFEPFSPFMTPSEELVVHAAKTNVRGILDSYHGDWDILIESLQNAVDALQEIHDGSIQNDETPRIEIQINYQTSRV